MAEKKQGKKETRQERLNRLRKVKRKRKPGKKYFHQDHEDAIKKYIESTNHLDRDRLYEKWIGPGFKEIIENIVNTCKFHYLENLQDLKDECLIEMTEKIGKFDPSRGYKAFSYFSVAIKNWFIIRAKRSTRKRAVQECLDDILENYTEYRNNLAAFCIPDFMEAWEREEYVSEVVDDLKGWHKNMRENTNLYRVYQCILHLFDNSDSLDSTVIDRAAVYIHIQQETGLDSHQIANALYRLRRFYKVAAKKYR
jgi:DNA-directed RNA polymerase specialized sigma subunit